MADRSYIQPSATIGVLKYLNPNAENILSNKILLDSDSPIQALNPGDIDLRVILPDPVECNGMFYQIINTSAGIGELQIYNDTNSVLLLTVLPNAMSYNICVNTDWTSYNFGGSLSNYYTKTEIDTNHYTKAEVDALIADIRIT